METNEVITNLAKKGFLLDKESRDFFIKVSNLDLITEILDRLYILTHSRIVSKKTLIENWLNLRKTLNDKWKEDLFLVSDFFKVENELQPKPEPIREKEVYRNDVKILSSDIIPYKRIEVKDFVTHFKNRYNFFKDYLLNRKELEGLISINKIGTTRNFSIIGLVSSKRITKNKNIILEVEDLTGRTNILIGQSKEPLLQKAKEVVVDDVIGLKCSGGGEIIYANDLFFPEIFASEKRKSQEENYALFISDIHVGSKLFLEKNFLKFINWINGRDVDDLTRQKIKKIKYIFITGDNVDGVGVYPGQEALLSIKDIKDQYKKLAEYFKMIPQNIKIIMCPGQHDAVRVPEPQPAVDEDFASELKLMPNVYLVSNPSTIEVDCDEKSKGLKVLMYHGASMHGWIDEIEDLRMNKAHLYPAKVVHYMIRHRHLSPMHSANVYVPNEKEDPLMIKEIPDIIATGDLHRTEIDIFNNILIICGSCWQSITPFEEKVGNQPDPCKIPMFNLKTREIKILDFSDIEEDKECAEKDEKIVCEVKK
jgi:DNA polymerase II small subunit